MTQRNQRSGLRVPALLFALSGSLYLNQRGRLKQEVLVMNRLDVRKRADIAHSQQVKADTLWGVLVSVGLSLTLSVAACTNRPPPPPPPPPPPAKNPLPPLPQPDQVREINPDADPAALPRGPQES